MSRLIFATVLVCAISTTFVLVNGIDSGPGFHIANNSAQAVTVIVTRSDKSRNLGAIKAGSRVSFTAKDDASMIFTVGYADGREIKSQPVYFTSGIEVTISISEEGIDVNRDTDT